MSNLRVTHPLEFPIPNLKLQAFYNNSSALKISLIVFESLLITCAMVAYIYQVNAIAVYTMGGTGSFFILATAIASIVQCISRKFSKASKITNNDSQQKAEMEAKNDSEEFEVVQEGGETQNAITMGQGEYVVFHQLPDGSPKGLSREKFDKVYELLNAYSPLALLHAGKINRINDIKMRYSLLKAKIKELDPTLEIAFIPKTLYELIFIRKCIREDVKNKSICWCLNNDIRDATKGQKQYDSLTKCKIAKAHKWIPGAEGRQNFLKDLEKYKKNRKCWHLCHLENAGDYNHPDVRKIAYRLNQVIIKKLKPSQGGFSQKALSIFAENEIAFLKKHHTETKALIQASKTTPESLLPLGSPTVNFGIEKNYDGISSMCIRNDEDAKILLNALSLECSAEAQNALILYRGSDFQKDSVVAQGNEENSYSLSYGMTVFAGVIHDPGATAFRYMRTAPNAYAILIPFEELVSSLFFVPFEACTIPQLFAQGESFHPRTKLWQGYDIRKPIHGVSPFGINQRPDLLLSNYTKKELQTQFEHYKARAVQLK